MDHVALGVPMLVLAISEDLDELLQDCRLAAAAALSELRGVVVVAVDLAIMLIITILSPEHCWTKRAGEMVDMILVIESGDVGPAESSAALVT